MSKANPFIIECRFLRAYPWMTSSKWTRWQGYATEKRRDQALEALKAQKAKWIEFRIKP